MKATACGWTRKTIVAEEGDGVMAACPTCHTGGANWKHCKACNMFWCANCKRKEGFNVGNKCPFCGVLNKVEGKEPR